MRMGVAMFDLVWLQRASLDTAYTSLLLRPLWPKLSHMTHLSAEGWEMDLAGCPGRTGEERW